MGINTISINTKMTKVKVIPRRVGQKSAVTFGSPQIIESVKLPSKSGISLNGCRLFPPTLILSGRLSITIKVNRARIE